MARRLLDGIASTGGPGSLGWGSASMPVPASMSVPGLGSGQAPALNPPARSLVLWMVYIVAGGVLGTLVSSALISALR